MANETNKSHGVLKLASIDLQDFCKDNENSGTGEQEVEITNEFLSRQSSDVSRGSDRLWRFVSKNQGS